jgi:hypothetical protein
MSHQRLVMLPVVVLALGCGSAQEAASDPAHEAPPAAGPSGPTPVATVPPTEPPAGSSAGADPATPAASSASASTAPASPGSAPPQGRWPPPKLPRRPKQPFKCRLDAPKLSADPCKTDADCAPSALCHAPECVAKRKAPPPDPNVMCTRDLHCATADANRCGCHQGRCALIPPSP